VEASTSASPQRQAKGKEEKGEGEGKGHKYSWLVVWNIFYFSDFSYIGNGKSSQLTNSIIFQRGWLKPPTRTQISTHYNCVLETATGRVRRTLGCRGLTGALYAGAEATGQVRTNWFFVHFVSGSILLVVSVFIAFPQNGLWSFYSILFQVLGRNNAQFLSHS